MSYSESFMSCLLRVGPNTVQHYEIKSPMVKNLRLADDQTDRRLTTTHENLYAGHRETNVNVSLTRIASQF